MKRTSSHDQKTTGILIALFLFVFTAPLSILFASALGIFSVLVTFGVIPMPAGIAGINYAATALAKAQPKLIEKFASTELREIDPVTYKALRRSSEIMFPSHKELRGREDRTIEAGYLTRTVRSLGTGRNYNPSGSTGVSAVLTPSFTTYNDVFSLSMKQAGNNTFAYEEMMQGTIENVLKNFSKGNEANSVTYIYNNRSAVNIGVAEGTFNSTNSVFEIAESAVGNRMAQITDTNMAENLYSGALTIFCDSIAWNKMKFLAQQGGNNAVNTQFQFEGKTYVRSLGLTAKAALLGYTKGFWIAAEDGTFGILDWIPKENRDGRIQNTARWSMFSNPIDGCDYAVYTYGIPQDSSATGGYTQDWLDNIEFSIDLAPEIAPTDIGGAGETVLQAFALI